MMEKENILEKALTGLLEKYAVKSDRAFHLDKKTKSGDLVLLPGYDLSDELTEEYEIPLLSWRYKRKFIELKKIVNDSVIENVCQYRFSCMSSKNKWSLSALLYREMDLLEFIGGGRIISLNAAITDNEAGSVVATLDNGPICSIEISIQLPSGNALIDRHEIIAGRGVASDQPVDTQSPMSSIYYYTKSGERKFTDVDFELYGLDDQEIDLVRSAFQILKTPDLGKQWQKQHIHLRQLVQAVFESNRKNEKINFN